MLRRPLFTVPAFALLALADAVACLPLAERLGASPLSPDALSVAHLGTSIGIAYAMGIHVTVASLAAILAAITLPEANALTRLTLGFFFLILTLTMPILGILLAAALAIILSLPTTGGLRPEERFVFGNPDATAARPEPHPAPPCLTPLAEGFRSMDESTLCQALLGLKHLAPPAAVTPFLQRFQADPRTAVQFTAQAVLSRATESLEETISTLRQRLAVPSTDAAPEHRFRSASRLTPAATDLLETRLALADTLAQLAAWTPPNDATTTIRRSEATALVTEILATHPNHPRALRLLARLQLAATHGLAAQATATALAALDPQNKDTTAQQTLLESLFHQARWDDLTAATRQSPPPPDHAESHAFWTADAASQASTGKGLAAAAW